MKKFIRLLISTTIACAAFISLVLPASAATKTKSKTLTCRYYDSIITSWQIGQIKATYTYSYNPSTNKLVNQKSINYSTSNVFGTNFTDISKC